MVQRILLACLVFGIVVCLCSCDDTTVTRRRERLNRQRQGVCPTRAPCQRNCGAAGYHVNRFGCQTCLCSRVVNCPLIHCPEQRGGSCPYGPARDSNGCKLCECALPPSARNCSQVTCMMHCPNGFKLGDDQCPVCQCYEPPPTVSLMSARAPQCGNISCIIECPYGRVIGADGCPSCHCKPAPESTDCSPNRCRNTCAFGRHVDSRGCEVCACRSRPVAQTQPAAASVTSVDDDDVDDDAEGDDADEAANCGTQAMCLMHCPHGFKTNERGCRVCECRDEAAAEAAGASVRRRQQRRLHRQRNGHCVGPMCNMFCPNGFKTDSNGCAVCACQDQPATPVSSSDAVNPVAQSVSVECRPTQCRNYCPFGYVTDNNNCQTCVCKSRADTTAATTGARRCPGMRLCRRVCEHGFKLNARGCEVCQCRESGPRAKRASVERANIELDGFEKEICSLPAVTGYCRALFRRWFYSPSTGQCQQFIYGGCGGNENNFRSEQRCMSHCAANAGVELQKFASRRQSSREI